MIIARISTCVLFMSAFLIGASINFRPFYRRPFELVLSHRRFLTEPLLKLWSHFCPKTRVELSCCRGCVICLLFQYLHVRDTISRFKVIQQFNKNLCRPICHMLWFRNFMSYLHRRYDKTIWNARCGCVLVLYPEKSQNWLDAGDMAVRKTVHRLKR